MILYYDCFAGISGDMNLGALIDLGVDPGYLQKELEKLPVHGYAIRLTREMRKGISGTRAEVIIDEEHQHLDTHDHGHSHGNGHHTHSHHTFSEIRQMIQSSILPAKVKEISVNIFTRVAEAEARIHNMSPDQVHFHEVGAIDSIIDIVGAAICLDKLDPDRILCSTVETGGGMVHCAHGLYPVPAPATAEILMNIPVRKGTVDFEATTPTGAAILAACVNEFSDKNEFRIIRSGYGIGAKDGPIPNVLRVFLCDLQGQNDPEVISSWIVECNIDDMNPELYEYIIDSLFAAGAKDVYITPVIMKKSRPAVKLSVLCTSDEEQSINEVLFRETSTIGLRKYRVEKTMLERRLDTVQTSLGEVRIKSAFFRGERIKSKPEYEDCIRLAKEKGIPASQVYREVEQAMRKKESEP